MKYARNSFALLSLFVFAVVAQAQTSATRMTFSQGVDASGRESVVITYTGLENPNLQLFEAVISTSGDTCFDNYNFANVRPADPDTASVSYDPATGTYKVRWTPRRENRGSCKALLGGDGTADGADFLVWQRTFGSSLLFEGGDDKTEIVSPTGVRENNRNLPQAPAYSVVLDRRPSL